MTTTLLTHSRVITASYNEPERPYCGYNHKRLLDGLNIYGGVGKVDKKRRRYMWMPCFSLEDVF